ncbi:MAG: HesB/IscA family protein [Candidatus Binatia bacterium]
MRENAAASEAEVVVLTDRAAERFREAIRKEGLGPEYGLRVGVTEGGCSGYSYAMSFESERRPNDLVVEQNGLTVYVDADSAAHLRGVTIDFVESLHGAGFKFVNPNAARTCGCGTSFS